MVLRTALLAAAALLCTLTPPAFAGDWTVGEIVGPTGTTRVQPHAVNADGVVVGIARFPGETVDTGFRWENGTMIKLQLPAGMTRSIAYDINDQGVIVGTAYGPESHAGSGTNGVVWTATQTTSSAALTAHNLNSGGWDGSDEDFGSSALGINEAGRIVGDAGVTWEDDTWGTSRTRVPVAGNGGGWSRLPLPDTESTTYGGIAWQINENGLILETGGPGADRAKLSSGGLPGAPIELIPGRQGLNDLGHVVGRTPNASASAPFTALLWNGSSVEAIGAGQAQSTAHAVNNSDWAVGRAGASYATSVLSAGNAWLWRPGEAAAPLFTLAPTGWSMYSAADINDDGLIVGTGTHGSQAVGFWMAPASIAHKLSGKVYGSAGDPVAGAQLRVVDGAGQEVASPVTGPDGSYEATLTRGSYEITVLPDGAYKPDGLAGCDIAGSTCRLDLARNRVVDFYGVLIVVPPGPGPGDGTNDDDGPTLKVAGAGKTFTASPKGMVGFTLGPFTEAVNGSVALATAKKVQASKAKILKLGSKSFRAAAGKKVVVKVKLAKKAKALLKKAGKIKAKATVTARDAAGIKTVKRISLTIKPAKRR